MGGGGGRGMGKNETIYYIINSVKKEDVEESEHQF